MLELFRRHARIIPTPCSNYSDDNLWKAEDSGARPLLIKAYTCESLHEIAWIHCAYLSRSSLRC